MQLKKILAVALAATTALSSGVAYDMLGASANKAEAAASGFYDVGETLTVKKGDVTYTFTVTQPILDGKIGSSTDATERSKYASNGVYDNGKVKIVTTCGEVTLSAVAYNPSGTATSQDLEIPVALKGNGAGNEGDLQYATEIETKKIATINSETGAVASENGGVFLVTKVDLNGENVSNADNFTKVKFDEHCPDFLSSIKIENFGKATTLNIGTATGGLMKVATTVDLSGTKVGLGTAWSLAKDSNKIETLDLASVDNTTYNSGSVDVNIATTSSTATLVKADLSGNTSLKDVVIYNSNEEGLQLNVSDCTNIENFKVYGQGYFAEVGKKIFMSSYDAPSMKGIKFITDGSSDASYALDLSPFSKMKDIEVVGAGIESFTAPSSTTNTKIDVHNNALTSVNLSSASEALDVNISHNKLMEADVTSLLKATALDVSYNYLTALDISSCEKLNGGLVTAKNFIASDALSKSSNQTVSVTDQRGPEIFKWAYTGDMGQGSGSESKALIKLGGSGKLIAAAIVIGAPDGFAEKLASTVTWTEANTADGSAVTLGESAIVEAKEQKYTNGMGQLAGVMAAVDVSANSTKAASEKVTVQLGNTKRDVNISNDNIALLSYDIDDSITSDNIKKKNEDTIKFAPAFFPTEAFVLNSQGTVDATVSNSNKPLAKVSDGADLKAKAYDFTDAVKEGFSVMSGVTFTKWNTVADGSGTAVNAGGKLKAVAEDTTVYAQYTENTYSVNFNKDKVAQGVNVTGSTSSMANQKFGDDITLTSNGFSTSAGNFYGWQMKDSNKFYSDGQSLYGLTAAGQKSQSATMMALYGEANHYISTDVTSIELIVGDLDKGAYYKNDIKPAVTGDPTEGPWDKNLGVDLKFKNNSTRYEYLTSDDGVAGISGDFIVAKGAGTANIYVRDTQYGNVATVTVTVLSKADAAASAELKAKQAATNKAIAAGEKTDVSDYSKFAAEVVKNADGENTVTITKGKNVKTAKINTITIGDKTYTVTRIGANAYKGMSKLTTVTTSNKVKVIGKAAFANCKKLTKVTLGKAVVKIGANAFKNDKKLAKILIKSKKLTKKARVGKNSFKGIKATAKFYIAKKAATYKKVKKAIKAQSGAPKKATYVKKYA